MLTKRRLQGSRVAKKTNGLRRLSFQPTTLVPPSRALCYIQRCPCSAPADMAKLPSRSLHFHLQSRAKACLPPYWTMRCCPRKGPVTTAVEVHHMHFGHISCLSATLQHAYRTGHMWHLRPVGRNHTQFRAGGAGEGKGFALLDAAALNLGGAIQ
ncbi:hypothetical protein CGRA01v4_04968 [Colletotrichum graminicola]|nr:hypothetical protein CGRA01v4_04968 [Colletotrichum graminicola]